MKKTILLLIIALSVVLTVCFGCSSKVNHTYVIHLNISQENIINDTVEAASFTIYPKSIFFTDTAGTAIARYPNDANTVIKRIK
jgi:uncharacterized protein YcfL